MCNQTQGHLIDIAGAVWAPMQVADSLAVDNLAGDTAQVDHLAVDSSQAVGSRCCSHSSVGVDPGQSPRYNSWRPVHSYLHNASVYATIQNGARKGEKRGQDVKCKKQKRGQEFFRTGDDMDQTAVSSRQGIDLPPHYQGTLNN